MTKDVKSEVVSDVEEKDVEVVDSKKVKIKTFLKNHYKGIILGSVVAAAAVYVGKEVNNRKDDLLDDEDEPKIIEGIESETTEESSEE